MVRDQILLYPNINLRIARERRYKSWILEFHTGYLSMPVTQIKERLNSSKDRDLARLVYEHSSNNDREYVNGNRLLVELIQTSGLQKTGTD